MENKKIREFWQNNPCGENLVLDNPQERESWKDFFNEYDKFRYSSEWHILEKLSRLDFKDKEVLEIGIGQAADSTRIINGGALYYGMDLTEEACKRAILRFKIFSRPYKVVVCADAANIPFAAESFDMIYSHGVLHHIPQIKQVIPELSRVLKKDGRLIIMLYAQRSLNYYFSILILRRIMLAGLYLLDRITSRKFIRNKLLRKHLDNARELGILRYLSTPAFLSKNTDGPDNPYSRVYSKKGVIEAFAGFRFYRFEQAFLNERHLPFLKIFPKPWRKALAGTLGWHLWCYGVKK